MSNFLHDAIIFAATGCAIFIVVFVLAYRKRNRPIHMTGRDWKSKQNAFYWSKKR